MGLARKMKLAVLLASVMSVSVASAETSTHPTDAAAGSSSVWLSQSRPCPTARS